MDKEKEFVEQVKSMLSDSEGKMTTAIETKMADYAKQSEENAALVKELEESVKAQGETVAKLKEEMSRKEQEPVGLYDQIKGQIEEMFKDKSDVERKEMVRSGVSMQIKTAGNITISGSVTGNNVARVSIANEWDKAPLRRTTIREMLPVVNVNGAQNERVVELFNRDGDAAFTAEGVTAPLVDFEMKTTDFPSQEVKAMVTVSERALSSITMLSDAIYTELREKMAIKEEDKLLYGAGSGSNEPDGVTTTASAFTLTTLTTNDPTYEDCINACSVQLETLNHSANFVAMNPIDYGKMKLEKDDNGRPIIAADRPGIGGMPVIKSNAITAGSLLVGDMSKMKLRDSQPLNIVMGYNLTGDFGKSIVSIRGTREIIFYVPSQNQNAFVYDTFANIIAAIEEVSS